MVGTDVYSQVVLVLPDAALHDNGFECPTIKRSRLHFHPFRTDLPGPDQVHFAIQEGGDFNQPTLREGFQGQVSGELE